MTGRVWRRIGFCLALAALAGCGVKGDPVAPGSEAVASDGKSRRADGRRHPA